MLLDGSGEVLGLSVEPLELAVVDPAFALVGVVGRPAVGALGEAAALAGPKVAILAAPESVAWVAAALPEMRAERAFLHLLGPEPRLPVIAPGAVRRLGANDVEALDDLPDDLRDELRAASAAGVAIAGALDNGVPVAFCYAGSATESLWDVSIDSRPEWRRRGFAARAAAFEIERLGALGKRPVWGAVESNAASRGLAAKLGFVPADEIWVFTAPDESPVSGRPRPPA